jgi:amidase
MPSLDLCQPITDPISELDAHALSHAIHTRQLSCRDVMQAALARLDWLNPKLNAVINRVPHEVLFQQADARDADLVPGRTAQGSRGFMHGFPHAVKDTGHVAGLPTTMGSPLLAQAVAPEDSIYVARMKAAGCIVIGKTNIPELGLGSNTYNTLFGCTPNAWDTSVTAGGSSGGAAVALAHCLLPLADGSDFMGSLRNPAGWNHVFGLRPSQGLVPAWPKTDVWVAQLVTDGPMARTVRDLAALLSIQAGHDTRAPLSFGETGQSFVPGLQTTEQDHITSNVKGQRIAWLADLDGHLAMDPGVLAVCESALAVCAAAGAHVEPTALGFSADALWQAWLVWRAALVAPTVAGLLASAPNARSQVKAEALWEHQQAQRFNVADLMQASTVRSAFYQHLLGLFDRFDVLALPTAQVWPFDVKTDWPKHINGRTMDTYHRWMEVMAYATFAGLPAISVPAGFHSNGRWPMGLQLIGRPRGDAALLRFAAGYEALVPELMARRPSGI